MAVKDVSRYKMSIVTELSGKSLPSHLFLQPAVVEVVNAGFDRPSNARLLTLRFPHIIKVHLDRSPGDALGYDEYQRLAQVLGCGEEGGSVGCGACWPGWEGEGRPK